MFKSKKMKRLMYVGVLVCFVAPLLAVGCAPAAPEEEIAEEAAPEVYAWRVGNLYPRGTTMQVVFDKFADDIETMSDGQLMIEWQMSGEGVGATELLSAVSSGLLEASWTWPALHSGEIPACAVEMGLPGCPMNMWEMLALWDRLGWLEEFRRIYAEHNAYYVQPCFDVGAYVISTEPINSIDDFAGMKFRCAGSYAAMAEELGVSSVVMGFAEAYTSMATGVIDGVMLSTRIDHRDGKWYEVAKWWYPLPIVNYQQGPLIVNLDVWDSLPDALQIMVDSQAGITFTRDYATQQKANEAEAIAEQLAAGVQYSAEPSAADKAAWLAAGQAAWDKIAATHPDCAKLINMKREFMAKLGY